MVVTQTEMIYDVQVLTMMLQLLKNEVVFAQTGGDIRHNCLIRLVDAVDYDTAS